MATSSACWRRDPPPLAWDLAALSVVAPLEGPWALYRPVTPDGRRPVVSGLDATPLDTALSVLARRQVALRFDWRAVRARVLAIDVEPLDGVERLGVRVNGRRVARFDLRPGRHTYSAPLPVEVQQGGLNTIDLRFDEARESEGGERRAARVWALALGDGEKDAGTAPLFDRSGGTVTMPAGALVFGLGGASRAEVRFAARGTDAGTVRVAWQPDGGDKKELWAGAPTEGAAEVAVALPDGERPGRLEVAFEPLDAGRARLTLVNPRVLAEGGPPRLGPTPLLPADDARAAGLRATLRDAPLVLVVLDAARAAQLGVYGYGRPTSPRIDAIAREAVVFDRAYTSAVFTLSAMSSLWTSLPASHHHAGVPYDTALPPEHLTLAEVLSASGRATAGFVGNTRAGAVYGMDRGFTHWHEARNQTTGAGGAELVGAATQWLGTRRDDRFFLYLHLREPHFPYEPPAPWDALFAGPRVLPPGALRDPAWYRAVNERRSLTPEQQDEVVRAYDRNMAYADSLVGQLEHALRARGSWDRALVLLTADHGEALGEHDGFISHNEQVYEESTRIPLVLKLPAAAGMRGKRTEALATTLEVAPTLADAAGVLARATGFQGRSLLPVAAGAPGLTAAVTRAAGEDSLYGVRVGRFKCVVDTRWGREELYDLVIDPGERRDLAHEQPGRMLECRQALHRHLLEHRPSRLSTLQERPLDPEQVENLRALGYVQ